MVTYPSAEQMFGRYVKTEWAAENGIDPRDIRTLTLSENVSYAAEALQPDMKVNGIPCVDFVITPNELARMLNKTAVNINRLEPAAYDEFGPCLPGSLEPWDTLLQDHVDVPMLELQVDLYGEPIKAAVVTGLKGVRAVLEQAAAGQCSYRVIRICS